MGAERALSHVSARRVRTAPSRRRALAELGFVAASLAFPACRHGSDRTSVLAELVNEVVVRDAKALALATRELDRALRAFADRPDAAALAGARDALKRTLVTWKRAYAFRAGPVAESNVFVRAMFWPVRPSAIDRVVEGERTVDEALVEQLGANQKGLYALEYLLFGRIAERAATEQERRLTRELSANVRGYAERGLRNLGDGAAYAERFAATGQDGVAKLAELTTDSVEIVYGKLDRVKRNAGATLGPAEVEGFFSRSSLDVALALLAGARSLFAEGGGAGLGALVAAISPPVTARVENEFAAATRALSALGAPLEESVRANPNGFESARAAVHTLERTLKLEVASALGLTLVFGGGDGD